MFDHEKLDVYGVELQFVRWLTDFLEEVSEYPAAQRRELVDQLDRASLSVFCSTLRRETENDRAVSELSSLMMPVAPRWSAPRAWTPRSPSGWLRASVFRPARRCWLGLLRC